MFRKYTRDSEYSYSLGIAPTIELVRHRYAHVRQLVLSTKSVESEQVSDLMQLCRDHHIETVFDDRQLERLTSQENIYVAGVFDKYVSDLHPDANHVVLAQPSDTGNLGTIMRTMLAFGFHDLAVILPAVDIWDPKVIRASMGAMFSLNMHLFPTIADFTSKVTHRMYMFDGKSSLSLNALTPAAGYSAVFGAEGAGLPPEYLQLGESVKIPQSADVDSLNLGVAVGIALYVLSQQ